MICFGLVSWCAIIVYSAAESLHHILGYAENVSAVLRWLDLLIPMPNDASVNMLSILRFGWKNSVFC